MVISGTATLCVERGTRCSGAELLPRSSWFFGGEGEDIKPSPPVVGSRR